MECGPETQTGWWSRTPAVELTRPTRLNAHQTFAQVYAFVNERKIVRLR